MKRKQLLTTLSVLFVVATVALAVSRMRSQPTVVAGQGEPVRQEVTRQNNPNYPLPNPFYFEGKVDYELLGIDQPSNAWEFAQRGIYKQDDLEDFPGAIADYQTSISMN